MSVGKAYSVIAGRTSLWCRRPRSRSRARAGPREISCASSRRGWTRRRPGCPAGRGPRGSRAASWFIHLRVGRTSPLRPVGTLVHHEEVRLERLGRGQNDVLADGDGDLGVHLDGVGDVDHVGFLDHAGHAHEIDTLGEGIATDYGGAGDDENIHLRPHQVPGDGHGASDVSQTVRVVGIHQDVVVVRFHDYARVTKKSRTYHLLRQWQDFIGL